MPQRDVGRDGGVGQPAFAILMRPIVPVQLASIWGLKGGAAIQIMDMSVHVLRGSISDLSTIAAYRAEASKGQRKPRLARAERGKFSLERQMRARCGAHRHPMQPTLRQPSTLRLQCRQLTCEPSTQLGNREQHAGGPKPQDASLPGHVSAAYLPALRGHAPRRWRRKAFSVELEQVLARSLVALVARLVLGFEHAIHEN